MGWIFNSESLRMLSAVSSREIQGEPKAGVSQNRVSHGEIQTGILRKLNRIQSLKGPQNVVVKVAKPPVIVILKSQAGFLLKLG